MLSQEDKKFISSRGNSEVQVNEQFETLKSGIPYVDLQAPAIKGDGIIVLNREKKEEYVKLFEENRFSYDVLKFTPASGAATRMFKFLFEFLENYNVDQESINAYINKRKASALRLFLVGLTDFPFYKDLKKLLKKGYNEKMYCDRDIEAVRFIKFMLDENALNFGNIPKGLFPFHNYKHHIATAFEEHLFEAALYTSNSGVATLHFTISKEHQEAFTKQFEERKSYVERKTNVTFKISYSYQSKSTDTVAITNAEELVRDANGQLLFRPGGHGALINNLNDQQADIIFIKNIDNVVVNRYKHEVAFHKKMLGGMLMEIQEKTFSYLRNLEGSEVISEEKIGEILIFLRKDLQKRISDDFKNLSITTKINNLKKHLNKPLRVCGMVKNEGEPGGGPFWVRGKNGDETLQIIESVQINPNDKEQQQILKNSTHFNPVDIVCGIKDFRGNKFNLLHYVDYDSGFIATKSYLGQKIKVLEHPGLWNGAMSHWNTVFVEVPLSTFNPVKTVNDLLKPAHQVQ